MPLDGILSGLFGGISGHQGALHAAFLINANLSRDSFIGTNVACAVIVDVVRLAVYGVTFSLKVSELVKDLPTTTLLITATLYSFCGSFLSSRYMEKVTLTMVRRLVGSLLLLVGLAVTVGWIQS